MELGLKERSVCVTGGTRGIGLAIVQQLLAEGAHVSTGSRSATSQLPEVSDEHADRLTLSEFDVLDPTAIRSWAQSASQAHGQIDGLVCNAGAGETGRVNRLDSNSLRRQFAIKVEAAVTTVQSFIPFLAPDASIVILNAVSARTPDPAMASVSISRAGLASYIDLLALELAPQRIRVNGINLGVIDSERQAAKWRQSGTNQPYQAWLDNEAHRRNIPLGRVGHASEVANAAVFLLSPKASYITRAVLDVSGGL